VDEGRCQLPVSEESNLTDGSLWDNESVTTKVLELRGVTKRYGWRSPLVLSGADLSLEAGTLTSIVGANGSGKSTLLRIGAGVTSASGGSVQGPRRVGYVPEKQAARNKFTGAEYLAHMGRIRGLPQRTITRRANELSERLGVVPGPHVSCNNLSKGNRQKVVLAQAFLGQLDLIVLDEPTNGLDRASHQVLDELVAEARAGGTSVLVSSHDAPSGLSRTYRLSDGLLEECAPAGSGGGTDDNRVRRVELIRRDEQPSVDALTRRNGVIRWQLGPQGLGLVLDVSSGSCDDLIRAALDLDWSVRSLVPIDSARAEGSS
jgi:ABC-type Mn2+/Zn2+ transport system ATPase subunit